MIARGLVLVVVASGVAAVLAGAVYGGDEGVKTLAILLPLGTLTVIAASVLVQRRDRVGGLRRQMLLSGALVVGQLLVAVGLMAWVMLVSPMDVLFTLIVVGYSALLGLWAARGPSRAGWSRHRRGARGPDGRRRRVAPRPGETSAPTSSHSSAGTSRRPSSSSRTRSRRARPPTARGASSWSRCPTTCGPR